MTNETPRMEYFQKIKKVEVNETPRMDFLQNIQKVETNETPRTEFFQKIQKAETNETPRIEFFQKFQKVETNETPRTQFLQKIQKVDTNEFETPVNMLNQGLPSSIAASTPIHKVENVNKADTMKFESETKMFKTEGFNNGTYGHLDFENGARYEGEFNQGGQF